MKACGYCGFPKEYCCCGGRCATDEQIEEYFERNKNEKR